MGIQVVRVETRDKGGLIFQNSPGNFTFDLVIEATVDVGDAAFIYTPNVVCTDLTTGAAAGAAFVAGLNVPLIAPNGVGTSWVQPLVGGRYELEKPYTVTIPAAQQAAVADHLFKYSVVLAKAGPAPTDADGAESEVFVLR